MELQYIRKADPIYTILYIYKTDFSVCIHHEYIHTQTHVVVYAEIYKRRSAESKDMVTTILRTQQYHSLEDERDSFIEI